MTKEQIPFYSDPNGFNVDSKYPCDTEFMIYNPMQHKYFLTEEALNFYGVDVERQYISTSNNKTAEFIDKVSKKVYDYIQYKAGWQNFQVQLYRIATASKAIFQDQYAFRKEFEKALIAEAFWIIDNGDSAKYSYNDMEKGNRYIEKPEEEWRDNTDIAPETKRTLEYLGLTRWFTLAPNVRLDINKY